MRHYLDINIRLDPEFPAHQVMSALYAKLHRILAQLKPGSIGVSFPGYQVDPPTLGTCLRLFGPEHDLERLMEHSWLQGVRDYVQTTAIAPIPKTVVHRNLRRVQVKSSPERLRRRQMRRHGLTESQARDRIPDASAERLGLPFVTIKSASTGQAFPLFLQLGPQMSSAHDGQFNAYGLSRTATTPWF